MSQPTGGRSMSGVERDEEAIFHVARRIADRNARASYLEQLCGDDVPLRLRVERLIAAEQDSSFLLGPTVDVTVDVADETEPSSMTIGPYRLLEAIGEGGMGVVYMAEQTRPVRRKVALKLIKPGMDSKPI